MLSVILIGALASSMGRLDGLDSPFFSCELDGKRTTYAFELAHSDVAFVARVTSVGRASSGHSNPGALVISERGRFRLEAEKPLKGDAPKKHWRLAWYYFATDDGQKHGRVPDIGDRYLVTIGNGYVGNMPLACFDDLPPGL